jgi:Holliday junction resolvase-like predicted endonuclease
MKQNQKYGLSNQIGAQGEQIATTYLQNLGFAVLDTNYLKPWGEIDVVARETTHQGVIIHFVEVKTVSYETKSDLVSAVSCGTWRPEENVTEHKLLKLSRVIDSWLAKHQYECDWQIDVAAIRLVPREKYATVKFIDNVDIT